MRFSESPPSPSARSKAWRAFLLTLSCLVSTAALASDWPQLGGPQRDFTVDGVELADRWPEAGPEVLWRRPLGQGYSGIAVAGGRAFTMYRDGEAEVVLAVQLDSGATAWSESRAAPFADYHRMEHGSGPHITPLIAGDLVITVGIHGDLTARKAENGELVWRQELVRELGGTKMDRGYSNSPLLVGEQVVVPIGGEGQGIGAFDVKSGQQVWKNQDFVNGYSSPQLLTIGGKQQLVLFHRDGVAGLDPHGGALLWDHPHSTSYGLNISVPLSIPERNLLFLSSAYNGGSRMLHLKPGGDGVEIEELWAHQRMRIHIGNAVRTGNTIWGANGDFGPVPFTGIDLESGEVTYRTREVARAFVLLADGKLILLDEDGTLALAVPQGSELEFRGKAEVLASKSWTPPTLVGNTLLVRDQEEMVALRLP